MKILAVALAGADWLALYTRTLDLLTRLGGAEHVPTHVRLTVRPRDDTPTPPPAVVLEAVAAALEEWYDAPVPVTGWDVRPVQDQHRAEVRLQLDYATTWSSAGGGGTGPVAAGVVS